MNNRSIAHTHWNCTYHIVFIPKYGRKIMYGKTNRYPPPIMYVRGYVISLRKEYTDVIR